MANDIEKAIDSLPGWVIPASVGGVVLIALFSQSKPRGPSYNTVVYGPTPSDPGLVSLASREVEAKQSVVQTLINAITSRDISSIQSDRDIHIAGIGASVANERTQAAEAVGLADSYNRTQAAIFQSQTAARIVDSQGATQKYVARKENNPVNHFIDQAGNVISRLFHW
jgi:hypothetical protein